MMNFNDLSKLDLSDLKNLDYKKIKEDLLKRRDVLINLVLIASTLVVSFFIYSSKRGELSRLKSTVANLEQKISSAAEHKEAQLALTKYIESVPKGISKNDLITKLTDLAQARGVKITSFTPVATTDQTIYDLITVSFSVQAPDYTAMWSFISDIENSSHALRVESWTVSSRSTRRRGTIQGSGQDSLLVAQIKVGAIRVKK